MLVFSPAESSFSSSDDCGCSVLADASDILLERMDTLGDWFGDLLMLVLEEELDIWNAS